MTKLRLAFMGTPDFAVPTLRVLKNAGHDIVAVYSQPPKPAGRGQHIRKTSAHVAAEDMGIEVRTPKTLRAVEEQKNFADLKLDAAVVVAYGLILPQPVLAAPRLGCLNIHASLLPRWRGAAPIQRAILAGDSETGVTIMQMDEGLDTGAILLRDTIPITPTTTAGTLHDALAEMGARLIVRALAELADGKIKPTPQSEKGVTYAAKLTRDEGLIDWTKPATEIERQIRAFAPWPGSFLILQKEPVKILAAEIIKNKTSAPGTLLDENFTVACGQDALRLLTVQRSGKNTTDGASFLRGLRLPVGSMVNGKTG
jgi:methionyl-tRNA formyltransferase